MRVKDLLLSYDFASETIKKLKMRKLTVFLEARDLFTITPFKGFDPELSSASSIPILTKEFLVGVNVGL